MIAFRSVDWIGLDWSGLPRLFFPRIARSVTTRPNAANWPVLDRYPSQLLWPGWSAEGHLDSHAAYMYAPWNSVVMALGVSWRLVDDETRHKTTPCMLSRAFSFSSQSGHRKAKASASVWQDTRPFPNILFFQPKKPHPSRPPSNPVAYGISLENPILALQRAKASTVVILTMRRVTLARQQPRKETSICTSVAQLRACPSPLPANSRRARGRTE